MSLIAPSRAGLLCGRLYRHGLWPATDSDWLDQPGQDDVLVRLTHAIGLPGALPDVQSVAVRVPVPGGHADLVLAGGPLARLPQLLTVAGRAPRPRFLGSVVPYRTESAEVVIGARANGARSFELSCASDAGEPRVFADLRLSGCTVDEQVAFDPARHPLPGLTVAARRARVDRSA